MSFMFDPGVICKKKLAISKLPLASFSKRGLVLNHLYENEFKLHMNLTYYHMKGTRTCFEKEAKDNLEMAH